VGGACIGRDSETTGIDAIMNMKGFAGDYGLERYPGYRAINLGSQVEPAALVARAKAEGADAILVSKVVTQRDVHKEDARALIEIAKQEGIFEKTIFLSGGPRVDHKTALELGFDAGFGPGTKPSDVAHSVYYRMMGGTGDVVLAPLYQVLTERGVRFEFFHRVRNLGLSDANPNKIGRITMGRQVTLKDPARGYQPLYDVKGMPCWPSEPLYEQIDDEEARQLLIDRVRYLWKRGDINWVRSVVSEETPEGEREFPPGEERVPLPADTAAIRELSG